MWLLIGITCLLMAPIVCAALVYLIVATWRCLEALAQGIIGGLRITWRLVLGLYRATRWALRTGRLVAYHLRDWHHAGSTWAGQVLQTYWITWSNVARRRYIAGQLRRLRRERVHK